MALRIALVELPAHHELHQLLAVGVGCVDGRHIAAVPQDRDAVRDLEHLVQTVRNIYNRDALGLELFNDPKEQLDLVGRESRGGLVHDHDPRVVGNALADLHHLLLCRRQAHHTGTRVQVKTVFVKDRLCESIDLFLRIEFGLRPPQKDVLGYRQRLTKVQLLINDGHALFQCQLGRHSLIGIPVKIDGAAVRADRAGDDLDECRLPGTVFAQQGVHLSVEHLHRHIIQGNHARIGFAYIVECQHTSSPFLKCGSVQGYTLPQKVNVIIRLPSPCRRRYSSR